MKAAIICFLAVFAHGEVRRALVVGIDDYADPANAHDYKPSTLTRERLKAIHGNTPRERIDSLQGAFNDARAIKEILVARFGFEESNVILLPNPRLPATADNILGLLQSFLIDGANPGDVSLFYFAGHGSRIRNTAAGNANSTGFDSTILPSDAMLGVPDIRGKELARIYARAPAKHISLTVVMDSCFSGAASRGAIARNRIRAQPANSEVSVEETLDVPLPEDSGVLMLAASQDYEPASELELTDLNEPHGAFTWALLHVLASSQPDERIDHIFQRTRALMQSAAPGQEPVLLAKNGLNARGILEQPAGPDSRLTVAAGRVTGAVVKLNGGLASGLQEGCELVRVHPSGAAVRLRVSKITGIATSDAEVLEGEAVRSGDLFELDKWTAPGGPILRLFVGTSAPESEILRAARFATAFKRRASSMWIDDPSERTPTHLIQWDGARWTLRRNAPGAKSSALPTLDVAIALRALPRNARVAILIPPGEIFRQAPRGSSVEMTASLAQADYVLIGRACGPACVEYAWALPDATAQDVPGDRSGRLLRSDWIQMNDQTPAALSDAALALARVAGWIALSDSPAGSPWPYHLAIEPKGTHQLIESGEVSEGDAYRLVLRGDPEVLRQYAFIPPRRVYVFVIDSWGHSTLLAGKTNLQNEFPRLDVFGLDYPETFELPDPASFEIYPPFGVDHYFLLTTANPIDSPETILEFDGVRKRGAERQPSDPLARLLANTAAATRGSVAQTPVNWSIERLSIVSRPKK
jgi:hypothetical protein